VKVLHISNAEVFGGIESILISLTRYQSLCPGLEHHFAVCFEGRLSEELKALGASVYMLGGAKLGRPISVRRARQALALAIRKSGCDLAVCHGPRSMILFAPVVRLARLPLVWWAHGTKPRRHYLNILLRRCPPDLTICCSEYVRQRLASLFPLWKSSVIHAPFAMNAMDGHNLSRSALRSDLGTPDDAVVVVLAGRMVPWKGHRLLIDALADLKEESTWQCWIVGGAQARSEIDYFRELQARAEEAGIADRVLFTGQRSDVPNIMLAADLYCQPNLRGDSFAIVFIEAMLAGLPVVTSALGGAIEAIDQDSGILVPPNDRQALSEALRALMTDSALRRWLGRNGPERARQLCDPAARLHDLQATLEAHIFAHRLD